jgi:short-chain fatty acids transporter
MKRVVSFFTKLCEAYLPDAFVFCLFLTLVVFAAAGFMTPYSPTHLIGFWAQDFWSLNAFAMQMVFVLISGHMLATTPLVRRFLKKICTFVRNESQALILISSLSLLSCFVNWGFGLIVSGVLAIELARKLGKVNFRLFVATAYCGFIVWHGGLSGSIPLKIAGRDEVLTQIFPNLSIPLSETIFSAQNLLIISILFFLFPALALWMRSDKKVTVLEEKYSEEAEDKPFTFRDQLENLRGFNYIFFAFFIFIFVTSLRNGQGPDINKVNFLFLSFSLLLHHTPRRFLKAFENSFSYASGIVIQFPFYAGLMGLMQHSGLADDISDIFIHLSGAKTLPLWTFLSGGVVNFFIPSGGGQWAVQGPIVLKAARDLGADPAKVAMALAWGDAWTNLIQPFWALPILAAAKLQLKDIMGHCLIFTFFSGLLICGILLLI